MSGVKVGVLHPGAMGVFVGACVRANGHEVFWASEGRSKETLERAEQAGLVDVGSVARLCEACDVIISVCPPHAAEDVAAQALAAGFEGLYVDANAIAPEKAQRMAERMEGAGVSFVDGGIVGGPSWESGTTWLYLAGERAEEVAALFDAGRMDAVLMGAEVGRASALKMCYAAYTKGTTALLYAIVETAEALGVREALEAQWEADWPGFAQRTRERLQRVRAKAWRFEGEMWEIAATFEGAGLPGGFHRAAGEVYGGMDGGRRAEDGGR